MTEKSALLQLVQVGPESTPGTAVDADVRLQSVSIMPSANVNIDTFRAAGYKFPTVTVANKDWTTARIEAQPTYDEMTYLFASVLRTDTATTTATNVYTWLFDPDSDGTDTPQTYTVQHGETGAGSAREFTYGFVTGLSFEVTRDSVSCSGQMIGQKLDVSATLHGTTTSASIVPISPNDFTVYMNDTWADLGGTKLSRNFRAQLEVSDRFNPVWPIDASEDSFAAHVEGEPTVRFTCKVAADSTGEAILANARAGDTKYFRVEAVGPTIGELADTNKLTIDLAVKVSDVGEYSDEDGVFAIEYTGVIVHDDTAGQAMQVTLINQLASL